MIAVLACVGGHIQVYTKTNSIDSQSCVYICTGTTPYGWYHDITPGTYHEDSHEIHTRSNVNTNAHHHDLTLPPVEWSVLYTGVYNTWVHDVSCMLNYL